MNKNKHNNINLSAPVTVGGIGGSGTRVIYRILEKIGYYMGQDLNLSGDNQWFTMMFNRPEWFKTVSANDSHQIEKHLNLFKKLMTTNDSLTNEELSLYMKAAHQYYIPFSSSKKQERLIKRMEKIKTRQTIDFYRFNGWGWKEPNSFIFLTYLSRYYKSLKFIFIIRHGLDMAFSKRNQYRIWSSFFQLDQTKGWKKTPVAYKKMEYWQVANRFAITHGKQQLGRNFIVINFDSLCKKPQETIDKLLVFLEIDKEKINYSRLYTIPQVPDSIGRYKNQDLSIFTQQQWSSLHEFGFSTVS